MDTQTYFKQCQEFDWFYDYSDDHRVWLKGESERKRLADLAIDNPTYLSIYQAWCSYMFSGPGFGTPKQPLPLLSDYIELQPIAPNLLAKFNDAFNQLYYQDK